MSDMRRGPEVSARPELGALAAIAKLARKGAYAIPIGARADAAAAFAVYSPRNDFTGPIAEISARAIAMGCRAGWLEADAANQQLRLSPTGLKALRQARSSVLGEPRSGGARPLPTPSHRAPEAGSLAWLRPRRDKHGQPHITQAQFDAGERLRSEYWQAGLSPQITANWSGLGVSRRVRRTTPGVGVHPSDGVIAARQRIGRVLDAVGPELAGILIDVCGLDIGLEAVEQARGWSRGTAKTVLQMALTCLARHYGLIPPETSHRTRLRRWRDWDYHAGLDGWR